MIQPLNDRILVKRLEGHGVERVTDGGIIIPATTEAKAKTKADTFRARVLAVGPGRVLESGGRHPVGVEPGEDVVVETWADSAEHTLYTGAPGLGPLELFISPDDVVCVVGQDVRVG